MKVHLLKNYYMEVEPKSFNLFYITKDKKGQERKTIVGYYSSITQLIKALTMLETLEKDVHLSFKEFTDKYDKCFKEVKAILDKVGL